MVCNLSTDLTNSVVAPDKDCSLSILNQYNSYFQLLFSRAAVAKLVKNGKFIELVSWAVLLLDFWNSTE